MGYYMGDFYRGDPGFFSFLGGLAKKAVGFIPGVGPALSEGIGMLGKVGGSKAASGIVRASERGILPRVTAGAKQVISKHPVLSAAGAAGAIAGGSFMAGRRSGRSSILGKHHKRMNPCNVKALRRAIRRAHGFERIARRVMRFSSPHKHKKFAGFKRAKKRS